MRWYCLLISLVLLSGCARFGRAPSTAISPPVTISGATQTETSSYLLWLERSVVPLRLSVLSVDQRGAMAEGVYVWRNGLLREFKQQGSRWVAEQALPYALHVRYDTQGLPVYQRFEINERVMPLTEAELNQFFQEANNVADLVDSQHRDGLAVYQGRLVDGRFMSCDGVTFVLEPLVPLAPDVLDAWEARGDIVSLLAKRQRFSGNNVLRYAEVINHYQGECFQSAIELE
uniref:DUF1481 domain-containing protein n=1 Tax=Thaumasiovibrio occultus TaxID=1891184 RepID=UPI000B34C772|nr:DUF1481 domain-containing protein [Thaumasiovibrio occultus]